MKKLKEGISTGSCAAAGAAASAIWQTRGICPSVIQIDAPIGYSLTIPVEPLDYGTCVVIKDAGDDPDVTHGCQVITKVDISTEDGPITFMAGKGIGTITEKGLKLPIGEPAINPVPRQMITKELRKIIKDKAALVTISIPNGEELAKKTFNPRLGVLGGLSILGTTGIVRPMSEEAMKDSLSLELKFRYEQGYRNVVYVLGTTGERALIHTYGAFTCVIQVSNYIGFMLDEAVDLGFEHILIGGFVGKLVKVAGGTMNTHSHISDGRLEVLCTHAALHQAELSVIEEIYECKTSKAALEIIKKENLMSIFTPIIEKAVFHCEQRTRGITQVAMVFLDSEHQVIAESKNLKVVLKEVLV